MSEPKEVTRAELEGRLESARLLHESIRAREEVRRERTERSETDWIGTK